MQAASRRGMRSLLKTAGILEKSQTRGMASLMQTAGRLQKSQVAVLETALLQLAERIKLKGELVRASGNALATSCLIGVPLGKNSSYLDGPKLAPAPIRSVMFDASTNSTSEAGKDLSQEHILTDVGDIPIPELIECGVDDDTLMRHVSDSVKLVMQEPPLRPLILGGDHSIAFPNVRAVFEHLGGQVDILHLDAHPDIYEEFEGNYYSHASPFYRIMEHGYCRRLVQAGIRSINQEGRDNIAKFGGELHEMRNFLNDETYLNNLKLGEGVKGVYISLDVDCLDAIGVSHIEPGGFTYRQVLNIIQGLQGDLVGADVVEYNPQQDIPNKMTAYDAAKFAREIAARMSK